MESAVFVDGSRKFLLFLAVASCQLTVAPRLAAADDTVTIDSGMLKGERSGTVVSFKGIPYAAPPVGDLRWRNPRPMETWRGIKDARDFGPSCMQTDDLPKSEDCLTLNVWTPAKRSKIPLPVMVWIYGGALAQGNTPQYPGGQLAARKVVFVSMNYRMGRLGYFAHPALMKESPDEPVGNYGYMDQLAALKWVQQNIEAFGGDPKKVTIFGESAGGGSVMAHMISPLSRGLFRGAILQSPDLPTARAESTPLSPLKAAEKTALDYAASLGINGSDAGALNALRALPAEKLTEGASAQDVLEGMSTGEPVLGVSGAIIDGRFLLETPEAAFAAGRQAPVPVIIGANDRDLGLGQAATKDDLFALFGKHAAEARSLYDPTGQQTLDELKQQVLADKTLVEPSRYLADEMIRAGQPTWWYRFSYVAEALRNDPAWKGTPHGFEIPFTLNIPDALVKDKVTPADWAMATLASAYWVEFATSGDPNGGSRPKWPQHDPFVHRVIDFTNHGVTFGADPLKLRLDLWQSYWEEKR
nr:carboxylesterase family protein [Rhizobium ruizarguesonis]